MKNVKNQTLCSNYVNVLFFTDRIHHMAPLFASLRQVIIRFKGIHFFWLQFSGFYFTFFCRCLYVCRSCLIILFDFCFYFRKFSNSLCYKMLAIDYIVIENEWSFCSILYVHICLLSSPSLLMILIDLQFFTYILLFFCWMRQTMNEWLLLTMWSLMWI